MGARLYWAGRLRYRRAGKRLDRSDPPRLSAAAARRQAGARLPAAATRIAALLQNFLLTGEEDGFLTHVRRTGDPHRVLTARAIPTSARRSAILPVAPGHKTASLEFPRRRSPMSPATCAFRLADLGLPPEDIKSSGLGYANLLYMATVVVELAKAREVGFDLFL